MNAIIIRRSIHSTTGCYNTALHYEVYCTQICMIAEANMILRKQCDSKPYLGLFKFYSKLQFLLVLRHKYYELHVYWNLF